MLIDVTDAERPELVWPRRSGRSRGAQRGTIYRGLVLQSHVDLAERQGGRRTRERDYAYLLVETGPEANRRSSVEVWELGAGGGRGRGGAPSRVGTVRAGTTGEMIVLGSFYNPPFLQTVLLAPGGDGVLAADVTLSAEPDQLGSFPAIGEAYAVALETFPLDRMLDEQGRPLKDVSHAGSRWLDLAEIERVLDVPAARLFPEEEESRAWLDAEEPEEGPLGDALDPDALPTEPSRRADPVSTARLVFARLDRDGSGFLEEDEPGRPGERADRDGDGRISLAELCDHGGGLDAGGESGPRGSDAPPAPEGSRFLSTRVDADGDLSRLLDGVEPLAYDKNGDFLLDVSELRRAVFDALDLDRDGALTRSELSRYPGELRRLRYADAAGQKLFASRDDNGDGTLSPREFTVAEPEQEALDPNGDGFVQLRVPRDPNLLERGIVPPPPEWPTRQPELWSLPPIVTLERVLATFDRDRDGELSGRELRKRPDLFLEMDRDGDARVSPEELAYALDRIVRGGVDVTRDGWMARWDLDGDGKVAREELEVPVGLRDRLSTRR
jgi:Ca2+-binding EF-hand superfamily protein